MNPSSSFPAPRVPPNATHALGGIWRLTVRRFLLPGRWLAVAGMLVVLALLAISAAPRADVADRYIAWAALFHVCFLVPIFAFISAGGVMRDDLKAGSVDYIFTRPVRRPAFVLFRYLAHVACAQLDFLPPLAVVIVVGIYRHASGVWDAVPLLLLTQAVVIVAFSAFGFLCGMLTSRYVIVGLVYGAIVEIGIGNVPTQLNQLSIIRLAKGILSPLLNGDGRPAADLVVVPPLGLPATITVLFALSAVLLTATAALFTFKELAGASGREA